MMPEWEYLIFKVVDLLVYNIEVTPMLPTNIYETLVLGVIIYFTLYSTLHIKGNNILVMTK